MNKGYKIMTWFMVIGFIFFFTTRLWNIDDRQRMNSYAQREASNFDGNLSISRAVYVEGEHEINLLVHETMFFGTESLMTMVVIHNLDGSYYVPEVEVVKVTSQFNQTQSLVRVELDQNMMEWYFVEVILLNEEGQTDRLTMDWRLIERVNSRLDPNLIEDFFFENFEYEDEQFQSIGSGNHVYDEHSSHHNIEASVPDFEYYHGHDHNHNEFEIDSELELSLAESHLERIQILLGEQPHNPMLLESVTYYTEKIQDLENQISEIETTESEEDESDD